MFIKVHKKNGQWFREKNGTLVGNSIKDPDMLKALENAYGKHIFVLDTNNKLRIIYYGYLNYEKQFIHFCDKSHKDCELCSYYKYSIFCRHVLDKERSTTAGYYVSN